MRPEHALSKYLMRLCADGRTERDIAARAPVPGQRRRSARRNQKGRPEMKEGMGRPWGLLCLKQT